MKYKETEPITPEIEESVKIEDIVAEESEMKDALDGEIKSELITLLGKVTELKHSHVKCCKTQETLGKVCEYILFVLNAFCDEFEYPETASCKQASLDPEDLLKMYTDLASDINKLASKACEAGEWLVVKKMQFSLGEIGEAIINIKKHGK